MDSPVPVKDGVGGFWRYATGCDELGSSRVNYWDSNDPYDNCRVDCLDAKTTPVRFYNGSEYRLYVCRRLPKHCFIFETEDTKTYYGCYDMEGNVSEYVMVPTAEGHEPAWMGSSWGTSDIRNFPASEPLSVEYITHTNPHIGFRLARTAP